MNSLNEKSLKFNKKIKINFEGGNLTSDAGLLLYKEFDEKIGFSKTIKENIDVKDPSANARIHKNEDIAIQRIYQRIAGYETDDNADELRHDPTFTNVLEKKSLASQPTISRFNNRVSGETVKSYQQINELLQDKVYSVRMPEHIIFDIDSTNFQTYGDQYGSDYNSHYSSNGYHPLLMFDGLTGDLIKAELRSGNVYTSRQVVRFIGPVLKRYMNKYPYITRVIRGDSGFATPELYEISEQLDTLYAIRLKVNSILYKLSCEFANEMAKLCKRDFCSHHVVYGEFMYKASSWKKERRVVVKIEKPEDQMCYNYTFIVTNMTLPPESVVKFYCNRGTMENFIKEGKLGLSFDKMSSTAFIANANKLQEMVLAYNFNNWFRNLCLDKTPMKDMTIETIRTKLIKIAAKIVKGGRYLKFKLCSSCPYKEDFFNILNGIAYIPI
ncbi:IS1380 family transposase [Clostridium sp. FP1]|uniref:IS1380 family transposase n=1 Tax=Clostridium sp. FP1 TaxID=2724076 RepID=UPI001CC98990|nr:IS1380 family transposase [Clostridium sp. FP1]MBZ9634434.1 IS1380 family transposase [Clostridium sp. FP1]